MQRLIGLVSLSVAVILIAGCLTVGKLFAQPHGSQAWSDHQRNATISLGVIDDTSHPAFRAICTAVIIAADTTTAYIVTAKHCFEEPRAHNINELRVRFAWEQRESPERDLGTPLQIVSADGKALWSSATDGHDVAAIRANDVANRAPHPQDGRFEALFVDDFATDSETFDGRAVFVYGYPGLVGNNLLTRAVTRGGVVAWTDPNGASSNVFLIDAAIFPGNSGGPVFGVPGGLNPSGLFVIGTRAPLLGIVSKSSGT